MARALSLASLLVVVACGSSGGSDDPGAPITPPTSAVVDAGPPPPVTPTPPPGPASVLTVTGNRLVDGAGKDVQLLGVNFDGAEYMCVQGRGIFDGPSDDAVADAIASWKPNVVRVPLNPHCWLGLDGLDPKYSGQAYKDAIVTFVNRLRARGLYVVLEAHWSSTVPGQATKQQPMIDREYGLPFWKSMGETWKGDRGVVFDPYNEPFLDVTNTNHAFSDDVWECWRLGCTVAGNGETYIAAGYQPLVDEIRDTGATNVILMAGLDYSNDLRGMVAHLPKDPANALAASFHIYDFNRCKDEGCWDGEIAEVAKTIPVVTLELGQTDCDRDFVDRYMAWADPKKLGYLGWTFNPGDCGKRPSLIEAYDGTPTAFGVAFKDRFAKN